MKSCPTCNRTYSEDSFTFCLNDGALLSAPYDPHATLVIPTRDTAPPPAREDKPVSWLDGPEMAATIPAELLPPEGLADRPETPAAAAEVEGVSGATVVTIVLLLVGSLVLAVFLSRCS